MSENKDDAATVQITELRTIESFLDGSGTLRGCAFGERPAGAKGEYWWRRDLHARMNSACDFIRSQSSTIESLRAKADDHDLALAAMDEIRKACKEIMGGNCAFIDDDFARALLTLRDEQESLRRELDAVRRDAERYRWLRKQMPADAITIESTRPRPATRSLHLSEDEADSAIDAAISEARGRE